MSLLVAASVGAAKLVASVGTMFASRYLDAGAKREDRGEKWRKVVDALLSQIQSSVERLERINPLAFPAVSARLDEVYVPLRIVSAQSDRSLSFKVSLDAFQEKHFSSGSKLLLIDGAGLGKSTVSRVLFISSLRLCFRLPIILELRRANADPIEKVLAKQFGFNEEQEDVFSEVLRTQELMFIFDGFDEVADHEKMIVSRSIRDFVSRNPKASFLITSRPEHPFAEFSDFTRVRIDELKPDEAYDLIERYGKAFSAQNAASELVRRLKDNTELAVQSFLKNPLLTSLLLRAFEHRSTVPVKRGEFYRQVYDALYDTHDLNKETGYTRAKLTGLQREEFHRALRALSAEFHAAGTHEVDESTFCEMARQVRSSYCVDLDFRDGNLLFDVTNAVPLIIRDGLMLRWAHRSLMDYFFAEYFLRDFQGDRVSSLSSAATGDRRRSAENFLTVVHESDPILYAKAVTLAAVDSLLRTEESVVTAIQKNGASGISQVLVSILCCFGVVIDDAGVIRDNEDFVASHAAILGEDFDIDSFTACYVHGGSSRTKRINGIFIYSRKHRDALVVPNKIGSISKIDLGSFRVGQFKKGLAGTINAFNGPVSVNDEILSGRTKRLLRDGIVRTFLDGGQLAVFDPRVVQAEAEDLRKKVRVSVAVRGKSLF